MHYTCLRNSERPPGLWALCFVIFLGTLEWGMVIPTLWLLLQRMGAPETYFGFIIGAFSLTRVVCQPLVGSLGDLLRIKALLCCCLAVSALGGVLYALAPCPSALLLSRMVCGLGASCTPLLFAWVARAHQETQQRAAAQVRLNTARAIGTFVGPFSSIVLRLLPEDGLVNQLNSAGWMIALGNLLGLALVWLFVMDLPTPEANSSCQEVNGCKSRSGVWSLPVVWLCLLIQVVTALLLAVLEVVPPIAIRDVFHLETATATCLLFGSASLLVVGLFAGVEALTSKLNGRALMCIGVGSIALGLVASKVAWAPGRTLLEFAAAWLVLAVPPAPLIRTPARMMYTSVLPDHLQGRMQGVSEAAFSFANFLGPVLGSRVVAADGLGGAWLLLAVFISLEMMLLLGGFPWLALETGSMATQGQQS